MIHAVLLLAQNALAAGGVKVVASKAFPAARISRIEIRTEAGDIKVKARPGAQTLVEAFKPADSEGHCDLKLHLDGGTLSLEARKPQGSDAVCDGGFDVTTPPGAELEAYAGSGDVEVGALNGALKIRTGSGWVRVKGARGQAYVMTGSGAVSAELPSAAFDARTGSGDVKITLTRASGLVSARSGSGSIQVSAPKGAKARVHATTASGKVSNAFADTPSAPLVIEAFSGSGDITLVQAGK